jgi:glycosyltransferase involved in cell wall biosynthesis
MSRPVVIVGSSAEIGGAELSLLPIVERLCALGEVVVLLPRRGPLEAAITRAGAKLSAGFWLTPALLRASRQYGRAYMPWVLAEAAIQQAIMAAALARWRPSAVYCNGFRAQLAATAPSLIMGVPVIWHVRDFVPDGTPGRLWSSLARKVQIVITNSSATGQQQAFTSLPRPPVVIWNGIELDRFHSRKNEPRRPIIGMVGHLTPWKGHFRFLHLLRTVRQHIQDAEGRIAGGAIYDTANHAPYPRQLASERSELSLDDACRIEHVPQSEMPKWLAGLTLLVHCPDRPEPFGRLFAEAMAVGIPIVSASGEGAADIIGAAGKLVPLGDETALSIAVIELLRDVNERKRLAHLGHARAARYFDVRVYAERVVSQILSVVRR